MSCMSGRLNDAFCAQKYWTTRRAISEVSRSRPVSPKTNMTRAGL